MNNSNKENAIYSAIYFVAIIALYKFEALTITGFYFFMGCLTGYVMNYKTWKEDKP